MVLRLTTWNVNGIRNPFAYEPWRGDRTFGAMFDILEADIAILQEAKIQRKDLQDDMVLVPGWDCYFSLPRHKKGYSGVVIYTRSSKCAAIRAEEGLTGALCPPNSSTQFRHLPASEQIGGYPTIEQLEELSAVDPATLDSEGRCLILEFPAFVLIGVYCPADRDETRDDFRLGFLNVLDARVRNLIKMGKRVILTGDLNISGAVIDSAPALERIRKGTETEEEYISSPSRCLFNQLVRRGSPNGSKDDEGTSPVLRDICREFHPDRTGMYTCWNLKVNARPGNFGARIDYILCSEDIRDWFVESNIQEGLMGSDHCPVYASIRDKVLLDGKDVHTLDIMNPIGVFKNGIQQPRPAKITPLPLSGKLIPEFDRRRNIKDMFRNHSISRTSSEVKASTEDEPRAVSEAFDSGTQSKNTTEGKNTPIPMNPPSKRAYSKGGQLSPSKRLKQKGKPVGSRSNGQQTLAGFFKAERPSRVVSEGNATAPIDPSQSSQSEMQRSSDDGKPTIAEPTTMLPTETTKASSDDTVAYSCSPTESWSKVFTKKPVPKWNGTAVRKCSSDYLASLYKACLDTYRVDEQQLPPNDSKRLFECVLRELNRLGTHPTLFPSPTAHVRFFSILEYGVAKMITKRKEKARQLAIDSFRLRANLYARQEEQILQRINRPSFKPDLRPWEQFLLKGSPGSGVVLPPAPPNGYVQVMPIGGVALHLRWLRRRYTVAKKCIESKIPASASSGATPEESSASDFKAALYPSSNIVHQNSWIALTPNPYYERRMPIPKHNRVNDRLESFNAVIERLEGDDITNYNGEPAGVRAMLYRTTVEEIEDV
ncbi:hypothetical protein FQN49_001039 [Arthroderma sp. PD_2]|nr:hypothetical protein FQN49_001039 [Arthroderma sp. PD_2]